jgi:hypothetical protein
VPPSPPSGLWTLASTRAHHAGCPGAASSIRVAP